MRKALFTLLSLTTCMSAFAQNETPVARKRHGEVVCCGEVAKKGARDATILSMMGWGVGLAVAVAAISALIENNTATSH